MKRIPWTGWLLVWVAWLVLVLSLVVVKGVLEGWLVWGVW